LDMLPSSPIWIIRLWGGPCGWTDKTNRRALYQLPWV
jgi:hypothetical protein